MIYPKKLKLESDNNDVVLFPSSMQEFKMTVATDPTAMHSIDSSIDIGATLNLMNVIFIKP